MITKFKIFDKNEINELPLNLINELKNGISFIIYKSKNNAGYLNYKQLKVEDFYSNYNSISINNQKVILENKTIIKIKMSNKDEIKAIFIRYEKENENIDNSIFIRINDEIVYNINDIEFDINIFIQKIIEKYKKYLVDKNWKIKDGN